MADDDFSCHHNKDFARFSFFLCDFLFSILSFSLVDLFRFAFYSLLLLLILKFAAYFFFSIETDINMWRMNVRGHTIHNKRNRRRENSEGSPQECKQEEGKKYCPGATPERKLLTTTRTGTIEIVFAEEQDSLVKNC